MPKAPATSGDDIRAAVAAELRAVRDAAQEAVGTRATVLPPARPAAETAPVPPVAALEPRPVLARPDNAAVNQMWELPRAAAPRGLRGLFHRLIRRTIAPALDAQVAFNARQVQLDNELLEYLDARLAQTHLHYDRVLGDYGRHISDVNE